MGSRDLRRHGCVVIGDVGLEIPGAMLELDIHPHPKLLDVERRRYPVDPDPLAGRTRLLGREMSLIARRLRSTRERYRFGTNLDSPARLDSDCCHCHRPWGLGGDVRLVRLVLGLAAG